MKVSFFTSIVHDWSKFTKEEWSAYANNFFDKDGKRKVVRDSTGSYDPNTQSLDFKKAWLSHQKNKHHWQAWCSLGDGGKIECLPIPERYVREMVADWVGAGMAINKIRTPNKWYEANRHKMMMHQDTRELVDKFLKEIEE